MTNLKMMHFLGNRPVVAEAEMMMEKEHIEPSGRGKVKSFLLLSSGAGGLSDGV